MMVAEVLEHAGFHSVPVDNGIDGIAAVKENHAVIATVDVGLPGIDGFEVSRRLHAETDCYIVMLSASTEETDVVLGLASGADEYVTKPFRPRELRARLEALLRRPRRLPDDAPSTNGVGSAPVDDALAHHDLRVDLRSHIASVGEDEVDLTRSEFDILSELMRTRRQVRTRGELATIVRGDRDTHTGPISDAEGRAIEVHITNLRRKLHDDARHPRYIETVRGVGYRLTA